MFQWYYPPLDKTVHLVSRPWPRCEDVPQKRCLTPPPREWTPEPDDVAGGPSTSGTVDLQRAPRPSPVNSQELSIPFGRSISQEINEIFKYLQDPPATISPVPMETIDLSDEEDSKTYFKF